MDKLRLPWLLLTRLASCVNWMYPRSLGGFWDLLSLCPVIPLSSLGHRTNSFYVFYFIFYPLDWSEASDVVPFLQLSRIGHCPWGINVSCSKCCWNKNCNVNIRGACWNLISCRKSHNRPKSALQQNRTSLWVIAYYTWNSVSVENFSNNWYHRSSLFVQRWEPVFTVPLEHIYWVQIGFQAR